MKHKPADTNKPDIVKLQSHQKTAVRGSLLAAIFMMATSAIGPGFITQTATFTVTMGASFAFAILASILIDFIVQLNIWRMVTLTKKRASDIANAAIPGSGYLLAILVFIGGIVFNIGNIAGAGLGLSFMLGIDVKLGGAISAILAIIVFASKRAGVAVDRIMIVLGLIMIAMTLYVAFISHPPIAYALHQTFWPDHIDFPTITTIVGGTIGGYITYAGAHRLLDRGTVGEENLKTVTKGALSGILVTGIMRYILFLAILGVVSSGAVIVLTGSNTNPAAQVFQSAAGEFGLRLFGLIFWAAGITSVIGAAYTSISFTTVFKQNMTSRQRDIATIAFISVSLIIYLVLGTTPTALLVFAGGFNGLILPIGFSIFMYVGWARPDLMNGHIYSRPLLILGTIVCILTWYMGAVSIKPIFEFLGM